MKYLDPKKLLKGRMAESLVEELLKHCENKVYRFGYEAVLQNLTQLEKPLNRESAISQRIRSIPDFIVINFESKPFFVEVKFRASLTVYDNTLKSIGLIKKFWEAKIILVTPGKPYFKVSIPPYFSKLGGWNWIPLEEDKDLNVKSDDLGEFNELVEKYFQIAKKTYNETKEKPRK